MISHSPITRSVKFPRTQLLVAALGVASIVACGVAPRRETERSPASGYLEVVASAPPTSTIEGTALPSFGALQIRSLDERSGIALSQKELSEGGPVRRQLPAGLYSVSWVSTDDPASGATTRWRLREPKILNVFAGRVTALRVDYETSPCPLLAHR